MKPSRFYFTTRDLLMMAALAALGGITGTYVNTLGDVMQSILGFAGTTQWAAGLHVLWLTLAMGLVGKPGAGAVTGLIKGGVELLSGNTHGLLVLLVDVVAGVLVDIGFAPFKRKDRLPPYLLAGGLASASNVIVFQLFAALPADILAYWAIVLVSAVAGLSGVVFAGILAWTLLNALRRAGVVRDRAPAPAALRARWFALGAGLALALGLGIYLRLTLQGPAEIGIAGAVSAPYTYPTDHSELDRVTAEVTSQDATTRYTGIPLRAVIAQAQPSPDAALILIEASDGYGFFITMEELAHNEELLLVVQGKGEDAAYSLVGPESRKAWVHNVTRLTVVGSTGLEIEGALHAPGAFHPSEWQSEMDSTTVLLSSGGRKLQGVALSAVLAQMRPEPGASKIVLHTGGAPVTLPLAEVMADDDVRIFVVLDPPEVSYAVARLSNDALVGDRRVMEQVQTIEVQ